MNYKKLTLLFYFGIITSIVIAQSDFRKGYVITNDNDTVYGYIDYRSDYLNSNKCVFKDTLNNEVVIYLSGEIKAYRFNDSRYFISLFIEELEKDVFLEFLLDGIVDVYYYKDFLNEYYFVNKNDSTLYRLNYDKKNVEAEGVYVSMFGGIKTTEAEYAMKSNKHIGILRYLFSDSQMTLNKVDNVGLNHKSLINIANQYHQDVCSDEECIVFEKQLPPVSFNYDFLFYSDYRGLSISNSTDYNGFDYDANISFAFGVGISAHPSRFSERLAIYLQVLYGNNKFNSNYTEDGLAGRTNYFYSDIAFSYLNNKLGFKYTFPKGKIRPELIFAYTYHYTLNSKAERLIEEEMSYGLRTSNYSDDILNVNYNGISIGAGINILKTENVDFIVNLQYDYLIYNMWETEGKPTINVSSVKLGLGIRF